MVARRKPSALEGFVAQKLVDLSVPASAKAVKNPLEDTETGLVAGRELYRKNCEVCHGYDGRGVTSLSSGLYPRPMDLQGKETVKKTDGELFYFIRNGVRNTAMPGWQLPDEQTWQLVRYLRHLPKTAAVISAPSSRSATATGKAQYVGSEACRDCHREIYDRWKKTLMANVVRDPHEHPDAIIPDLVNADPMVHFTADDIAFVYGSKWKQRYFKKAGDDYYVFPAQWDVTNKKWRPYFVKDDWWAPLYPPDNFQRPTGALCDGCHSVNYDIKTKKVTEWNVGCEKCHGPGSAHVEKRDSTTILNPAALDYVAGNDLCIQCHSQGRPLTNPIDGKYYDWPVGFEPGRRLQDYWELEKHQLGTTTFTHFPDGTAHKNRMQGNDFVTSEMYAHGVSCFTCHDAHGTDNPSLLRKPANVLCLDCHGPNSPAGPRGATIEEHTHHKAGSAGGECIACHMPKIAQTIADVNVRSHTFRFVPPAETDALKIPNACNVCHSDKTTAWATEALKTWADRSPWRMQQ
jgi:predicted CXXCH cytochrome family protein